MRSYYCIICYCGGFMIKDIQISKKSCFTFSYLDKNVFESDKLPLFYFYEERCS